MTAAETLSPIGIPLREDKDGVIRVVGTRVPLDTIVAEYWNGLTAEDIASAYDTLDVADVYAVLTYYLRNRATVDEYLAVRERRSAELRREMDARSPWGDLRERLLARRAARTVQGK